MLSQNGVKTDAGGILTISTAKDFNGETKKWNEIGPLLYRAKNGQELIAFRKDEKDRLQMVPNYPAVIYQKAGFENNGILGQVVTVTCLCVMALTLLFWPAGTLVRRHYHQRLELDEANRQGRLWIRLVCALNLIFVFGMLLSVSSDDPGALSEKSDLRIHIFQAIGVWAPRGSYWCLWERYGHGEIAACGGGQRPGILWYWRHALRLSGSRFTGTCWTST